MSLAALSDAVYLAGLHGLTPRAQVVVVNEASEYLGHPLTPPAGSFCMIETIQGVGVAVGYQTCTARPQRLRLLTGACRVAACGCARFLYFCPDSAPLYETGEAFRRLDIDVRAIPRQSSLTDLIVRLTEMLRERKDR